MKPSGANQRKDYESSAVIQEVLIKHIMRFQIAQAKPFSIGKRLQASKFSFLKGRGDINPASRAGSQAPNKRPGRIGTESGQSLP